MVKVDPSGADWFDPVLTTDTPLYVDPFLVFDDDSGFFAGAHDDVVAFFASCRDLVARSGGDRSSPHWARARRMLTFPEPKEFALGLSMGSPHGSGTGSDLSRDMAEALDVMVRAVQRGVDYVDVFALFVPGLGVDRISDMFCNILKRRFVAYTQQACADYGIPTEAVQVPNATWQTSPARWSPARLQLPRSPVTGGAVLLTPERYLQNIPQRVTPQGFWGWAQDNISADLRADLNLSIGEALSAAERGDAGRRLARLEPERAFAYIDEIAEQPHSPYDTQEDPDLLVGWYEGGRQIAATVQAREGGLVQPTEEQFCEWVGTLVDRFQHAVEDMDGWRLLWNDDHTKPRQEKIVQSLAGIQWAEACHAADVDLTRESNAGRGPVDFKFSAGWQRRALLEVKLMSNRKWLRGAQAQLPQYLRSEKVRCGYYVCVGFSETELSQERQDAVRATCKALSEQAGRAVHARFVDGRPKESASKLLASPQIR